LELEIKTLQNAPRDADKLRKLLQIKQRQKEEELIDSFFFLLLLPFSSATSS
jgi:hypothetical protein